MRTAARFRRARIAAVATLPAMAAVAAGALALAGPAQAATAPAPLPGTHPAWATAAHDRGLTPAATRITAEVYLAGRDPAGLAAYANAVSTLGSASYHHYLSAAQQEAAYGPSPAQLRDIGSWLREAGLKITGSTEQFVSVTGTATQVRAAFGTRLHDYALAGHVYYAPSTNAEVPARVASAVLGVSGLTSAAMLARPEAVPTPRPAKGGVTSMVRLKNGAPYVGPVPCSSYWGQKTQTGLPRAYGRANPLPVCGYTPNQLRSAYGVGSTGLTGKGVTVAIVDAYGSPTIESDANKFAKYNDFPQFAPGQFREIVTPSQWNSQGACGGEAGWQPEESLDVEATHTMAPGARILYVGANSCNDNDFMSAFGNIVDHKLATIVTNSWGGNIYDTNQIEAPGTILAYTQLFQAAATEGIGFYFSSGDCSTSDPTILAQGLNCDPNSTRPQTSFPASDNWVTAVGASAIGIGARGNRLFETGMGDSAATLQNGKTWSQKPGTFLFGSGGGTSDYFTQPSYQANVVPSSLSHTLLTGAYSATAMRVVPDVAMEGDLIASTMVGFTQLLPDGSTGFAEAGYGGTSVSSPLFAGIEADAQQAAGVPIGFANPEIYSRYRQPGLNAFRDITDHPGGQTYAAAMAEGRSHGVLQAVLFTLGADWTLHATPGYDNVTGLGSPTPAYLESFRR
jgi:subtilase family serine protease